MKQAKGITLVTLVVTIVLILILSGVTISTMMGENGILTKAVSAKEKTEIAALKEKIGLIMLEWEADKALDPTATVEDFWERLIEEGIIIDENDIGEPETDGANKVYTIDTGDGYVMEVVVNPSGNIAIGDIGKGTDLPLKIRAIDVTEKSSNSISVEVRIRENEGKETAKLSYYYKTGEGEYKTLEGKEDTTDLTATFVGLKKGITYSIKVVAEKDGQTAELVIDVKTEELKEGKVTASTPIWNVTTNTASITLSTTSEYQIQWQKNGTDGEWTTVDEEENSTIITGLNHNDRIYTRLWDGYNGGYEDSVTIEDKEEPTVTITEGTVTTNSIQVSVSSSDAQGGMPTAPTYNYYYKKKADKDYPSTEYKSSTETICTFEELDQETEYDIKVTTQDKVGNTGTKELTEIKTGKVDVPSTDLKTGSLIASAPTWNTATRTANITLSTTTDYQIQWQKNGIDGEWTTVEKGQDNITIPDLNYGDTIFVRLYDGKNAGSAASTTIRDGQEPIVTVNQENVTASSIKISVSSVDNEWGMPDAPTYNYYIKKKADANYPDTAYKSSTETTCIFKELDQDTEYDIKVTTQDKEGNTGTKELITVKTEKIDTPSADLKTGSLVASEPEWDQTTGKASVTLTTTTDYQIQYQIGGTDGEWTTVPLGEKSITISDLNSDDVLYVRLKDGKNEGIEASTNIRDDKEPIVTVTKNAVTTNSIQVSVSSVDNELGMPTNPTYNYYIKKKTDTNYPNTAYKSSTETICTFKELDQDTEYDIKVTTQDKVGNTGTKELTAIKTGKVDVPSTDLKTGSLIASAPTWDTATRTANITLSTTTDYQIQWQKNGIDGEWTTVEKGQDNITIPDLNPGDTIFVRLYDGKNAGSAASTTIRDGQEPIVTVNQENVTASSIKISVSSVDNEWGMPTNPTYNYYIKKKTDANYPDTAYKSSTETICTFKELDQDTEYDIKVTTQDKAGNTGTKELTAIKTEKVDTPSADLKTGSLVVSEPEWDQTTGKASVTLTTTTDYQIQYQIGGTDGEWTTVPLGEKSTTVSGLNSDDVLYVRLKDGKNEGIEASTSIRDDKEPIVTLTKNAVTTNSIQVSVSSVDNELGMPTNPTYNYYIKKKTDTSYPSTPSKTGTVTSWTFTGLTQTTEYDVKVTTQDKAGNTGSQELTGIQTATVSAASANLASGVITASTSWTASTHTASITLNTTSNNQIQYQKNSATGTWTTVAAGTTSVTISSLSLNDTIYARLWDGYNAGSYASVKVSDGTEPTVTVTKGTVTSNSITVSVSSSNNQSGMPTSPTYKYYIKKKTDTSYPTSASKSGTVTSYTFTGLTQTTEYDIKVTTQDNASNTGTGTLSAIKTSTVTAASTNLSSGVITASTTWTASSHTASVKLTTTSSNQIQYQKNSTTGTWTTVAAGTTSVTISSLSLNDTIYARLWDGYNAGSYASVKVSDGTAPTVTVTKGTVTSNSITVSVSSSDNQSGMPTSPTYKYYIKKKTDTSYPASASKSGTVTSYTFTGLTQTTEYDIKVTTQDNASNTGTKELTGIQTATVSDATAGLATAVLKASTPTWNKTTHKASITLSTTTNYQIQYWRNGVDTAWTTGTTVSDLSHNDIVFARLWDGNNAGNYAQVKVLDGTAPAKATISFSSTALTKGSKITAAVIHTDNQSGPNATSCKWIFTTSSSELGTSASNYTGGTFSSASQSIQYTPTATGNYWLHVLTIDNAGNSTETVSSSSVQVSQTYTATQVASTPSLLGKEIGNYSSQDLTWKIFYASTNGIYLIASDRVPVTKLTSQATSLGFTTQGTYGVYWESASDFKVTSISSTTISTFMLPTFTSTSGNTYKMTASLMDVTKWNAFRDSSWADTNNVIGSPTLEMWVASWNKKYPSNKLYTSTTSAAEYVGTTSSPSSYTVDLSETTGYQDKLFFPTQSSIKLCPIYWFATPSPMTNNQLIVKHSGVISACSCWKADSFRTNPGVRPVVHLKSSVKVKEVGESCTLQN